MRRAELVLITAMFLSGILPRISFAQATSSALSGVVKDASGAVIAGATVTVAKVEMGVTRSTQSDAQGRYRVGELQPGNYQVSVAMTGFSKETRKNIVLAVGQEQALNFDLQVGAVEQEVTVTGAAPVVETTTAEVAALVSQERLRELPLNGRSFTDLITLNTSAMIPSTAQHVENYGNGPQLSVSGARTDANNFLIDGTDMNDAHNNTPGSAAGGQLGVDLIREYQVITSNPKAEYGRNAGATVNAVSRSGTNDLHGSAFEFLRNSDLDARNFFDTTSSPPPFKRNQFGGTFGGPIQRDHTFYFVGYEGLRQSLTQTFIYNVPTAPARQGILPSGAVPVDSRIVPYLNLYPLPNGSILGGGVGQYIAPIHEPTSENFGSARIDQNFSQNDFLFGRWTIDRASQSQPQNLLSGFAFDSSSQYLTLQEDHIFSPTLINTLRFGLNRTVNLVDPIQVPGGENLGFVPGQPVGVFGAGGISSIGPVGTTKQVIAMTIFQGEDSVSLSRGPHQVKFGVSLERFRWNSDAPAFIQGSIVFSNLTTLLQAGPTGTAVNLELPGSNTFRGMRSTYFAMYGQDDYRVSPRLMLNYGLRWEFTTGLDEVNGLLSHFTKGPILSTYNDLATGSLYRNHKKNFEPRLGFNWGLDKDQKTVLSGGFGIFHNEILANAFISFRAQAPFYSRGTVNNLNASQGFPNLVAIIANSGFTSSSTAFRVTREFDYSNFKVPTFYRFNLTLQRELPGQMALKVGYVGATGYHMTRRDLLNYFPQPVVQPDGSLFFPPSPVPQFINPEFSQIEFMASDVNSSYNSLVASLQKRFNKGLTFQASYTWSKSLDDYSQSESNYNDASGPNPQFAPDRKLDRARSIFNVPQVFVGNWVYELPIGSGKRWLHSGVALAGILGGWQAGGIITIQQGVPFTVGSKAPAAGYGFVATRPNLKPGVDVGKLVKGNVQRYFDFSAFSVPPPGTIGNASRNLLLGPGLESVNLSLSKSFPMGERFRLQFRSEFFNLLNRANFSNPQTSSASSGGSSGALLFTSLSGAPNPAAGVITSTSIPSRQIQFGLKLIF